MGNQNRICRVFRIIALSAGIVFTLPSLMGSAANSDAIKPAITGADAQQKTQTQQFDRSLAPIKIEKTGDVAVLPKHYPESWVMVDEAAFFGMAAGKMIILDAAEPNANRRIKGIVDKSLLGNFAQAKERDELYIMESFHRRGTRGPKEDVLSIYDKKTLNIKKEFVWPKPNRLQALPQRYAIALSEDERFLFSSNFDPAASFTVIDLDTREMVQEIGTPGCVLTYPVGKRAVASVCSNGAMLSTHLNNNGTLKSQVRTEPFFDTSLSPIFEHPVYVDGIAYFWSFEGVLHSFDMRGDEAKYLGRWDAMSAEDKKGNWRPSGLVLNDSDDAGNIYTIFQPDGKEGTQTHGGSEVRVYDHVKKKLLRRIETPGWAISMAVTRGKNPLVVVTNGELNLDVFNAHDGSFVHTLADFGGSTPLSLHKSY